MQQNYRETDAHIKTGRCRQTGRQTCCTYAASQCHLSEYLHDALTKCHNVVACFVWGDFGTRLL